MTVLLFRTDTTDKYHSDRPIDHPTQCRMMKLEAVLYTSKWVETNRISVLMRPDGWVPRAGAEKVHGLTADICEQFGLRPNVAIALFMDMVRSTKEIASWGLPFHSAVINIEINRLKANPPQEWTRRGLVRTDIMALAARKWNNGVNMKIEKAVEALPLPDWNGDKMAASLAILRGLR